jgi:hypothetical protein
MVVVCKVLGGVVVIWLALCGSACGGPSCIRHSDCVRGQSCIASSCQGPGAGSAAGSAAGGEAGGGNASGVSGGSVTAGVGGQAGEASADAGQAP